MCRMNLILNRFNQFRLMLITLGLIVFPATILAEEFRVGMEGWEFNPVTVNIHVGDTVIWVNDDDTNHNIAFNIAFDSAPTREKPVKIRTTKNWSLMFDKAGTYSYVCKIHEGYDMKGTVIVSEAPPPVP